MNIQFSIYNFQWNPNVLIFKHIPPEFLKTQNKQVKTQFENWEIRASLEIGAS